MYLRRWGLIFRVEPKKNGDLEILGAMKEKEDWTQIQIFMEDIQYENYKTLSFTYKYLSTAELFGQVRTRTRRYQLPKYLCHQFLQYFILYQQQYWLFPLPHNGLTGLECGVKEPVLGHKDCENVSLVVNDYYKSL